MPDDKIIRFDVETSGGGDSRIGDNSRRLLNSGDYNKILSEAERQYSSLGEKAAFLKQRLDEIRKDRWDYESSERNRISNEEVDPIQRERKLGFLRSEIQSSPESFAFRDFSKQVQELINLAKKRAVDEERNKKDQERIVEEEKSRNRSDLDIDGESIKSGLSSVLRGGIIGGFIGALGVDLVRELGQKFVQFGRDGYETLRRENDLKRTVSITKDFANDAYLSRLNLSRDQFFDLSLQTAYSRRSGYDLERETLSRSLYGRAYGLTPEEFSSFDKFVNPGKNGINTTDLNEGMNSLKLIANIIERSEQHGILGVSGSDISMLPEKIQQVNSIIGTQFASGEKTDVNTAINLMIAGQKIGGRFSDTRLGETVGSLNSSIQNPGNAGMRAFIFESLRRSDPSASYTDILARMEQGASSENLQAILPSINKLPQGELRRAMLYRLFRNWNTANRMDIPGNITSLLNQLEEKPIDDQTFRGLTFRSELKNDVLTTELDRSWKAIQNAVSQTASNTAKMLDQLLKISPSSLLQQLQTGGVVKQSPFQQNYYFHNILEAGSPTGEQLSK